MTSTAANRHFWLITLIAAAILMVTMGTRQSIGLYLSPLNTSTGLGIASVSFAMAIGQFSWGAVQPIAGAIADKYGTGRVLAVGIILLAGGMAIVPLMSSSWGLILSIGLVTACGSGAGSFSVLIGAVAQRLPAEQRGIASGVINAGGSLGQFVFAPLTQRLIVSFGWMNAMWTTAVIALMTLPLARALKSPPRKLASSGTVCEQTLAAAIKQALADPSYLLLHAGFFTCGFHIAFLITHLPGEIQLCGLPGNVAGWSLAIIGLGNIVGSLGAGWGMTRARGKYILFWMYASRAIIVALYLLAPKTETMFYLFATGLGLTWLATVPPTAGIVGKLFGTRYLGTLFGLTLLSHQIGGFFGAWLGGLAMDANGNYQWMWYADIALALLAALSNLPIKEAKVIRTPVELKPAT